MLFNLAVLLLATTSYASEQNQFAAIKECTNEVCIHALVPPERKLVLPANLCDGLDGKTSNEQKGADDLGLICRLAVARNHAAHRSKIPCRTQPDTDDTLKQDFLRRIYNEVSYSSTPHKPVNTLPESYNANNGVAHGSSFFERQFRYKKNDDDSHEASFMTYYCITEKPRRYVPYFFVLRTDGRITSQGEIATVPLMQEKVLAQLNGFTPEYVKTFQFLDINHDGVKDIVILSDHITKGYQVSACLYARNASVCQAIGPSPSVDPGEGSTSANLTLDKNGLIRLTTMDDLGKPRGTVSIRITDHRFEITKREGNP